MREAMFENGEERETLVNWLNLIKQIVDGYNADGQGIPHGVQKDAVQNSWDARLNRKTGQDWRVQFNLICNGNRTLFSFLDTGTTGLTGKILKSREMEEDMPDDERWGRFESLAFTKNIGGDIVPLGSRGRGKFVFVGASRNFRIFYDSLRPDGTYRLGQRRVEKTRSPIRSWDNEQARHEIVSLSGGLLEPLANVGTRIVIEDPIPELVEDVKSGVFEKFISETWWEILAKFDAKISIIVDGKEVTVKPPAEFVLPESDSPQTKIWIQENVKLQVAANEYKVKRLHLVSNKDGIPENLRGVAIQRGYMKVCSIEPRYLPQKLTETIYGYATFDETAEAQLLVDEGPEHYSLDYRHALPKVIRQYVQDEIEKFAQEKLGWHADARAIKREKQRSAERAALRAINRVARSFGYGSSGQGAGTGHQLIPKKPREGSKWKKIRIQSLDLKLPRENDLRVNYNEAVGNISARVLNTAGTDAEVKMKIYVIQGRDKLAEVIMEQDLTLAKKSASAYFGPFDIKLTNTKYPLKGMTTIVIKLISMMKKNKGTTLDEDRRTVYLDEDPPLRGSIFEECIPIMLSTDAPEYAHLMGIDSSGREQGIIVRYNVEHPAYLDVEDNEEAAAEYLFRLMGQILCKRDLQSPKPLLYALEDLTESAKVVDATMRLTSEFEFIYHDRRSKP